MKVEELAVVSGQIFTSCPVMFLTVPSTVHISCIVARGSPRAGLLGYYIYLGPFQNMGIIQEP